MTTSSVLLGAAAKAVQLAKDPKVQLAAKKAAKYALDHQKEIERACDAVAPMVKKAAEGGKEAGLSAARFMKDKADIAAKKAGEAGETAAEAMRQAAEKRSQEKEIADMRKQLLDSAACKQSAADFEAGWAQAVGGGAAAPLSCPGYLVFATYKNKRVGSALHDYKSIFIMRAEDMGKSAHRCFEGCGNPDVYADVKFGEHVVIYAFPDFDFEDDNDETLEKFIVALGADESYNARTTELTQVAVLGIRVSGSSAEVMREVETLRAAFGEVEVCADEMHGSGVVEVEVKVGVA